MIKDIYSISYKMRRELYQKIGFAFFVVFFCIVFISLIMSFFIYPVMTKSESMSPDIPSYSVQLVSPLLKMPKRGDVMVVSNPNEKNISVIKKAVNTLCLFVTAHQWKPFADKPRLYSVLRRVVALPGDTVYMKNYILFVKPKGERQFLTEFELTESKYNILLNSLSSDIDLELGAMGNFDEILLSENEFFLLGDNRLECSDSRLWGPIKKSELKGKVLCTYFPFSEVRFF